MDVLVEADPSIGLRFVDLGDEIERALGRRVDLVLRRAIKPSMWKRNYFGLDLEIIWEVLSRSLPELMQSSEKME